MMEIVRLKTRQQTLDAIRSGEIKEYAREIRPNTQEKYCEIDPDGYVVDIDGVLQPRIYDIAQFYCGHEACSCRIVNTWIELFEDDRGELVTYEEAGEEYIAAQVVYSLGEQVKV